MHPNDDVGPAYIFAIIEKALLYLDAVFSKSFFSGIVYTYLDSSYQGGPHVPHLILIAAEPERKLQRTFANYKQRIRFCYISLT